jgi:hypothetical protein
MVTANNRGISTLWSAGTSCETCFRSKVETEPMMATRRKDDEIVRLVRKLDKKKSGQLA